jgi:hypothetical protein
MIAVSEIAANTVVHAGGAGILQIWRDGTALVCEIRMGDGSPTRSPGATPTRRMRTAAMACVSPTNCAT